MWSVSFVAFGGSLLLILLYRKLEFCPEILPGDTTEVYTEFCFVWKYASFDLSRIFHRSSFAQQLRIINHNAAKGDSEKLLNYLIIKQWWQARDRHVKGETPHFGWHASVHQHTISSHESMPHSCVIFRGCGGRTRGPCSHTNCSLSKNDTRTGHGFQCCRDWKSILQSCFRNRGLVWPRAASGKPQGLANRKWAPSEGK